MTRIECRWVPGAAHTTGHELPHALAIAIAEHRSSSASSQQRASRSKKNHLKPDATSILQRGVYTLRVRTRTHNAKNKKKGRASPVNTATPTMPRLLLLLLVTTAVRDFGTHLPRTVQAAPLLPRSCDGRRLWRRTGQC